MNQSVVTINNAINFNEIKISLESINTICKNLMTKKEELEGYVKELEIVIDKVSKSWSGTPASDKFMVSMKENYCRDIKELCECLESYSNYLKNVYYEYNKINEEYYGKFSRIAV